MTDYNDGQWHGWNGGKCPVHDETEIEYCAIAHTISGDKSTYYHKGVARRCEWLADKSISIIAFRVTNPYVEPKKPREVWLHENCFTGVWSECSEGLVTAVLFHEVLPD